MHGVELVTANIFAPQELLLILLLALVFFGGKKLPEAARGLGQAVREFHRATAEPESPAERPPPVTALPAPDAAPQKGAEAQAHDRPPDAGPAEERRDGATGAYPNGGARGPRDVSAS
jgi:sec-independent protein translocase protein TatA